MDVVFVAFNAEELGLLGSQNFFNKYYNNYSESYNINIDCVAQKNCNTLSMGNDDPNSENLYNAIVAQKNCNTLSMGNDDPNSENLYNAMKETFDKENVIYDNSLYATKNGVRYGTSDHIVIRKYGAPSLVLGDSTIMDVVHTNKDNLDNIDYSDLEKLSDGTSDHIVIRKYGAPSLVLGDSTIMDVVHTNKDNLDNIDYSDLEKLSDTLTKFLITNNGNTFNK